MRLVQVSDGFSQLLFCTNEICAIIRAHDGDLSSSAYETAQGVDAGTGVKTVCYLYVNSSDGEAGEQYSILFDSSLAPFNIKGSKEINTYISERWFIW